MFLRTLKFALAAMVAGGTALTLHAQMAQDPLLSRTAAVEPNIVFMFDDSLSMNSTAIYQYGGGTGYQGQRGPNNDAECNSGGCVWILPPTTFHGRSPDVNLMYYDPRVTYTRRVNADGTSQAAGSTAGVTTFDVYFYKPPTFTTYNVANVNVTSRGSAYPLGTSIIASFPPPPAGGTQATATVQTTATNNVGGVIVNNPGHDFNAGTTMTFSAPPAGGITATGTVNTSSSLKVSTTVTITARGVDYVAGTPVAFSPPPAVPGAIQATGTVTLSPTNKVGGATATNIGSGYTTAPAVVFAAPPAPGIQATGTANIGTTNRLALGTPPANSVVSGGAGFTSTAPTVTIAPPATAGGVQATATVTTTPFQKVTGVTVTNGGWGFPSAMTATFGAPGPGGIQATATVSTAQTYKVNSIGLISGGSYSGAFTTGTINFSAPPPGGVQATGTVTRTSGNNRPVTSVNLTNAGSGYTTPPAIVSITGLGTQNTAANISLTTTTNGYAVTGINMSNQGSGYVAVPALSLSGGGSGFNRTINLDGNYAVGSITLTNAGTGYLSVPAVSLSGPGSGASFNLQLSPVTTVNSISISNPGSGYSTPPVITLTGGGGTGAAYTANLTGTNWVTGVTVTNPGWGYTSTPTISFGSPGTGAAATAATTASLGISGISIVNPGAGYTAPPTILLAGFGSGTGFTYTVNAGTTNQITGINVTSPGGGYTTQPPLTLSNTAPGAGVAYTVNYNSVPAQPASMKWDGVGTPTTSSSYFTTSYTPDAGSPLAAGATVIPYPNTASSATANYPKFRKRTDCGATTCSWAQERQNYANWKTYHSTRIDLAKTGIALAFQPLNPTFRLGWGTINTLNSSSTLDKGVRLYDTTVQSDFLTWLYARTAGGTTPNRYALDKVGTYYKRADSNGPWAASPNGNGSVTVAGTQAGHATCRRAYAMLMTDGYYNDDGSVGGTAFSLADVDTSTGPTITSPTNYTYQPIGPYSDTINATKIPSTFADVAMKYWVNDLRTDIGNNVKAVPGDEAYWQHLNFYAIGLGLIGTLDATNPAVLAALTGSAGTTPPRTLSWPTPAANDSRAIDDMWHATVNGRGKMLNAKTADELNAAIQQMMSDISGKEGSQAGVAVSTASLTSNTKKYTPTYTPITWNGNVTAYNLDPNNGNQTGVAWQVETLVSTDPTTGRKTFSSIIPDFSTRNIFVGNGSTSGTRAVPFTHASLTSASLLGQMNGAVTVNMINHLRGESTNEDTSASAGNPNAIYRERLTRLGDIVNSTPVFVKNSVDLSYEKLPVGTTGAASYRAFVDTKNARAEGLLFVGANDGMLHAFRDGTFDNNGAIVNPGGVEVFAYVPYALLPTLNQLTDKTYVHSYYVDGPMVETDGFLPGANRWANLVLGTTGGGAGAAPIAGVSPKAAVFAIDTTSLNGSTNMSASNVLWEVSSATSGFSELGYVLTDVQSGTTVGGQWVAIFGNGYESKSCQARLFVVNLETGALLKEINTGAGSCGTSATKNGLGGVRVVRNSTRQIIGVYGGDLLGNVWKFNLSTAATGSWGMDLGGQPLYKTGASQPITSAPIPLTLPLTGTSDPKPGYMVVFGTGKFYEVTDITTTSTQTVYGIWDPVAFGAGTIPAGTALTTNTLLIQQTIGAAQVAPNGNTYFSISGNTVDYVGQTTPTVIAPRRGWWFNLPNTGQRLVYPLDSLQERYIIADTISPANVSLDPCANTTGGTGYLYIIDALNGGGPTEAILDTNADGSVDTSDMVVAGIQGKADGRNVALWVNSAPVSSGILPESSKFVILSSDSGSIVGSLSCRLIDPARCQPTTPPPCTDPSCLPPPPSTGPATVRSRQWRQLFLR